MGFAIYMFGMLLLIGAFVYGARQVGLSDTWIGIVSGRRSHGRDRQDAPAGSVLARSP